MILDDGEWVSYATPLSITELASHILYYYSVDKVGNIETTKNISFINKKSVLDISMKTDFNLGIQVTIKNNAV